MKFKLSTASTTVTTDKMELYTKLGFKYTPYNPGEYGGIYSEPMYTREYIEPTIEISSLEELLELADKVGCSLVVDRDDITIYDSHIE